MPNVDEARKAYENAVLEDYEAAFPYEVKEIAKDMARYGGRGEQDPYVLVPWHDKTLPYTNVGNNYHAIPDTFMPYWATYVPLAQLALRTVKEKDIAARIVDAKNR